MSMLYAIGNPKIQVTKIEGAHLHYILTFPENLKKIHLAV
jgi:hypothetical protein